MQFALSEALKDVVYLRKLVRGLGAPEDGPSELATDSKSARDVPYNPEHDDRMKHGQCRHFGDHSRSSSSVTWSSRSRSRCHPFVRTHDNIEDFFTKPMHNASTHREFRNINHECARL